MISSAVIIPTGDELKSGIILDTDSPMVMQELLSINSNLSIIRNEPLIDNEDIITDCINSYIEKEVDLIILSGGSGEGHKYSPILGKDFTHLSLDSLLNVKCSTELYGKNGHLWCKLICGIKNKTIVINLPGPYKEAKAAIVAFKNAYLEDSTNLKIINAKMSDAVKMQYGSI